VHFGDAFPGYAIALTLKIGGVDLEGLEHVHFDHDGLVDVLLVALRPLDGLVVMHNTIAPLLGKPPFALVPQPSSRP
jgi:hypothetical protein